MAQNTNVFNQFKNILQTKLSTFPNLVTEDLLRHWYIDKPMKSDAEIEKPYKDLSSNFLSSRARADLYFKNDDCVIEFKFHKKVASSTTCTTDNWGYVFRDLNRLFLSERSQKLLVYIFDEEMYKYYNNNCPELLQEADNSFKSDAVLNKNSERERFNDCAFDGLTNSKGNFAYDVNIIYSYNFISGDKNKTNFYLRIYEVK